MRLLASVVVALAVAGCGKNLEAAVTELVSAKELWQSKCHIKNYTYSATRKSAWGGTIDLRVTVQNGAVADVVNEKTKEHLPLPAGAFTIQELFNLCLDSLKKERAGVVVKSVSFHPQYGYPTHVLIDDSGKMDAGYELSINSVENCAVQPVAAADGFAFGALRLGSPSLAALRAARRS